MKPLFIDTENTVMDKNKKRFAASPHYPDNSIVLLGGKLPEDNHVNIYMEHDLDAAFSTTDTHIDTIIYVGHNIKHDLLYLMKTLPIIRKNFHRIHIYDTMVADYMLTGQDLTLPSLDELSSKYGGTLKDNRIQEYWDNGAETEDIPHNMLEEYLRNDVLNTELIFNNQMAQFEEDPQLFTLFVEQMNGLAALTEMEFNGMHIDLHTLDSQLSFYFQDALSIAANLRGYLKMDKYPEAFCTKFNPDSVKQLKTLLNGGMFTYQEKSFEGTYKNGKPKPVTKAINIVIKPLLLKPVLDTSSETLEELERSGTLAGASYLFIKELLEYRSVRKTFGMLEGYKEISYGDYLHPNFNMGLTATGRLSCSSPNLQNIKGNEDE